MESGTKVNARDAQRLATRERLFHAAVAEFKVTGVDAADVSAIVEAAGVAHGTFFFHFPTKEHVVAELGQREEVRMAKELDGFLASPRGINATVHEFLRLVRSMERRLGTVLFREQLALYFSPTRPELRLWPDHPVIARLITEFELARDRGEIDDQADPANSVMFFLLGLFALLITHERNVGRAGVLEQYVSTAFRGLDPR
jgi:AcrR family transcriptional regulator